MAHWLFTDLDNGEHYALSGDDPIEVYRTANELEGLSYDIEFMEDGEMRLILDDCVRVQVWKEEHRGLVSETEEPGGIDAATYGR